MLKIIIVSIFFLFSLNVFAKTEPQPDLSFIPGEFVVKLHKGKDVNRFIHDQGFDREDFRQVSEDTYFFKTHLIFQNKAFIEILSQDQRVKIIEPNFIYKTQEAFDDPELNKLWGLVNTGQRVSNTEGLPGADIQAEKAWEITGGRDSVVVAVIDTGVDYNHPDLKNNIWVNEIELNGQVGVDDDENGFVDDIRGYNFADSRSDPFDGNSHGTHVSGTISGEGNNSIGIVGVAHKSRIMALKFLRDDGSGSLEAALQAIDYAVKNGARIINASWGSRQYSKILEESIDAAGKAGILFVAAAGNYRSNNDRSNFYPANYDLENVISVAALNNKGELSSFSNFGFGKVDIAAPGQDIFSTMPKSLYGSLSGTSMAAPHVAGAAALLLSQEDLSPRGIILRLRSSAKKSFNLRRKVISEGWLDAHFALRNKVHADEPGDPYNWGFIRRFNFSTDHPYKNSFEKRILIQVPRASQISVHFLKFETEAGVDKLKFLVDGQVVGSMSGDLGEDIQGPVINGDHVELVFTSDVSLVRYGFDIDRIKYKPLRN